MPQAGEVAPGPGVVSGSTAEAASTLVTGSVGTVGGAVTSGGAEVGGAEVGAVAELSRPAAAFCIFIANQAVLPTARAKTVTLGSRRRLGFGSGFF